ncbi:hypothetical protein Tco_1139191, partial [Tanacetum coccineum]
ERNYITPTDGANLLVQKACRGKCEPGSLNGVDKKVGYDDDLVLIQVMKGRSAQIRVKRQNVPLWGVREKFEFSPVEIEEIRLWVMSDIGRKWKTWKYELKKRQFDSSLTIDEIVAAQTDTRVEKEDFKNLMTHWFYEDAQKSLVTEVPFSISLLGLGVKTDTYTYDQDIDAIVNAYSEAKHTFETSPFLLYAGIPTYVNSVYWIF